MGRERFGPHGEGEDEDPFSLKAILREVAIAAIIVGAVFGGIFAYTQVYPPLVVVESKSMQHSDDTSHLGVIDTGDLVLVQAVRSTSDVVTWVEGRATGYSTYGDYGDVIVFRKPTAPSDATPVIHRALLYVRPNPTDPRTYDIPGLLPPFPSSEWEGERRDGSSVQGEPVALAEVTIHGMGWQRDLEITFNLTALAASFVNQGRAGFITMGDNNAYGPSPPYDAAWVVPLDHVIGHARGEIPWFGLLKLTFQPTLIRILGAVIGIVVGVMVPRTNRNVILIAAAFAGAVAGYFIAGIFDVSGAPPGACCREWGDSLAPRNSWDSLLIALPLLFGSPLIVEGGVWAWMRYVAPRIRRWRGLPDETATDPPEIR